MSFEPVIGLEIHAQLLTNSKIFCGCSTAFGAPPNTHVCPVCLGLPGALPVLNRGAVDHAIRAALALGCTVHDTSIFARKNYFYPDLPKGYQISQYERPLATAGALDWPAANGTRRVRITRVHLEEDAGKSLHEGFPDSSRKTYVDFNRSGVPLIEIVTEPDLASAADAAEFFTRLREILVWLGVNDGNMEEGSLRCDANVSVRPVGETRLGTKAEVKNLNSFRFLQKALEHEIDRQIAIVSDGTRVVQETRLWDAAAGRTVSMRSKEEAHDYRYFPEPDLGLLVLDSTWIAEARRALPELPRARRARLAAAHGLAPQDAETLVSAKELADYYERTVAAGVPGRLAANWVTGEVLRWMKERRISTEDALSFFVSPERLAGLLRLVESGEVSAASAKDVLVAMLDSPAEAPTIVAEKGLGRLRDTGALEAAVAEIVSGNPSQVALYRSGKTQTFGWFVGQVMKKTGGRADPAAVREALTRALESAAP